MAGTKISELPVATLPLTGTELVPVVQGSATVQTTLATMPYVPSGTGAVTTTVQTKLRETVSVKDFGAVGDGVTDDTAAIQAAIDSGNPVFVPYGTYYLATPLKVQNGNVIYGVNGRGPGYAFETRGSYFKPATCAIQTASYTSQYSNFTLKDIGFINGTVQVDLGLFHEVEIKDCYFYNPSVGALVIVRGEKHLIQNVRVDSNNSGYAIFGFSLGRWQDSLYTGYTDAFFSPDGPWIDRLLIQRVSFQAGGNACFAYGIKSTNMSQASIINMILHGRNDDREQNVIYVASKFRQSTMIDCAPDTFGGAISPAPAVFEFGRLEQTNFLSISPGFAGNNNYIKGFSCEGGCFNSTWSNCRSDGDNVNYYGWYFRNYVNQTGVLINCRGSYYHANTNFLIKNQITQISCNFTANEASNPATVLVNNQNKYDLLMADSNGSAEYTGSWGVVMANGGGGTSTPFRATADSIYALGNRWTYGPAAPTTGTWATKAIVYNSAPATGSYIGWVCTASGTPGTWKGFGLIA